MAEEAPTAPQPVIEVGANSKPDAQIQARLQNIFNEINALNDVRVSVREGVVTLAGSVANDAHAEQALEIANRAEGGVAVEDEIERTLDLSANVNPFVEGLRHRATQWLRAAPLLLLSLVIFSVIVFCGHLLAKRVNWWRRVTGNRFLAELLGQAIRVVSVLLGLVLILNLLGSTALLGTILGGAGVLGLAIGFAVRDTMENYISSIMLSIRQPFRANDHVVINEHEGVVMRLTSRATVLMTLDGNHLRIPNATVFKGVILNYTTNPERRFNFELGVDANDDPVAAIKVGLEAMRGLDFVLSEPAAKANIEVVGDSSIVLVFHGWVNQGETDYVTARTLAISAVKNVLEGQGFTLPEPIYRLRFDDSVPRALADVESAPVDQRKSDQIRAPKVVPQDFDVNPDTHLAQKVQEERSESAEEDLLDHSRPVE
jgi:small-conductance mechanosensitive channel